MNDVTITIKEQGPFLVKGPIKLVGPEGQEIPLEGRTAALCRCGGSAAKPFCDGTHSKIGFDAAERARDEHDGIRVAS